MTLQQLKYVVTVAETGTITANSVPDFNFAETHIFFNENCQTKTVAVTGKNIPDLENYPLSFLAFEKRTTDQPAGRDYVWERYGDVIVTEDAEFTSRYSLI